MSDPIAPGATLEAPELDDIRKRINHLKVLSGARNWALPVAAASAGAALFVSPVVFPIVSSVVAIGLAASKFYSDHQRKIVTEELQRLHDRGITGPDIDGLSSANNSLTVAGSSS
jgi:hypothetical protein